MLKIYNYNKKYKVNSKSMFLTRDARYSNSFNDPSGFKNLKGSLQQPHSTYNLVNILCSIRSL
ncbi:hypothetical protein HanIR_Chr09g0422771 [Helianthus annuus]|nr:hypothetical protein HanIR_Chr09g0422771 [Helianthus annuus]